MDGPELVKKKEEEYLYFSKQNQSVSSSITFLLMSNTHRQLSTENTHRQLSTETETATQFKKGVSSTSKDKKHHLLVASTPQHYFNLYE
mmetsp:Transcript_47075/g.78371  ORF Transcript_47075/g.78371 Transcript_47075/m.78371 type:complete len:89 (+) Transcript_47075:590-856(+)